jgi:hypothetical protein
VGPLRFPHDHARAAAHHDPVRVAVVLAVVIVLFCVLGASDYRREAHGLFDLDGEGKPPAAFAGLLLLAAGALAVAIGKHRGRAWTLLGAFLAFMAVDEALKIHERLQTLTGVDWQLLYLPVIALGAVVWLQAWRDAGSVTARARRLLTAGAAAWVVAQLGEALEYRDGEMVEQYAAIATAEEVLEMVGSSLFLLAFLLVLRRLAP